MKQSNIFMTSSQQTKTNKQFQTKNLRMSIAFHPNYFSYGPYFAGLQNLADQFFGVHLLSKQFELHSFRLNIIRTPTRGCRANRQPWFWSLLEDNCKACTPRSALARPLILENGPKTESCDSGVVVLSKHSSEQTQKIPELLLHKNKKSLNASVMAEALHKLDIEAFFSEMKQ